MIILLSENERKNIDHNNSISSKSNEKLKLTAVEIEGKKSSGVEIEKNIGQILKIDQD